MSESREILVMLMGGNPLPDYVVAKHLLNDPVTGKFARPDRIVCLYSAETKANFVNLQRQIRAELGFDAFDAVELGDRSRDQEHVRKALGDKLRSFPETGRLHLNVTGGTKPMAVAAHQAASEYAAESGCELLVSDLDPNNFKLAAEGCSSPPSGDLRDSVSIELEHLFGLHGICLKSFDCEPSEFYLELKRKGAEGGLFGIADATYGKWDCWNKDKRCLEKIAKKRPDLFAERLHEIEAVLGAEFGLKCPPAGKDDFRRWGRFIKFLTGEWLEDYIFENLRDVSPRVKAFRNLVIGQNQAQIDVAALQGYQLFIFSCTTGDSQGEIKPKAFEAVFRAAQLGGDQAQVVIVSFGNEKSLYELRLKLRQFNASRNTVFIGKEDIRERDKLRGKLQGLTGG